MTGLGTENVASQGSCAAKKNLGLFFTQKGDQNMPYRAFQPKVNALCQNKTMMHTPGLMLLTVNFDNGTSAKVAKITAHRCVSIAGVPEKDPLEVNPQGQGTCA